MADWRLTLKEKPKAGRTESGQIVEKVNENKNILEESRRGRG